MLSLGTRWAIYRMKRSKRKLEHLGVIPQHEESPPREQISEISKEKYKHSYYKEDEVIDVEYVEIN